MRPRYKKTSGPTTFYRLEVDEKLSRMDIYSSEVTKEDDRNLKTFWEGETKSSGEQWAGDPLPGSRIGV